MSRIMKKLKRLETFSDWFLFLEIWIVLGVLTGGLLVTTIGATSSKLLVSLCLWLVAYDVCAIPAALVLSKTVRRVKVEQIEVN